MILDGHVHVGSWTEAWYTRLAIGWHDLDSELLSCGIDGAVVTATDRRENRELLSPPAGLAGRYWLFPWIDPGGREDLALLEREADCVAGLKIHPSANKVPAHDERLHPYYELARARGWAVLVHCGRWQEMSSYQHVLAAARTFPEVPFILAHMGGDTPPLAEATQQAIAGGRYRNVWLGLEGMREYWVVARGIERLGVKRFLFGSDYPVGHPRMYLGLVEALRLSEGERRLILGENLRRILDGRWREG